MGKPQRTITKEFKQEAVQLLRTSGKSAVQIAKDLGVSDSALSRWVRESRAHPEEAFPGKGHQSPADEELRRLKRENELLRQERDILKKAIAIFTQQPA
jgi:transposase